MCSPEKGEGVSDLQMSFVFGNSFVTPQPPHIPPEDAEPQEPHEHYSTETLCLSRTELTHVAESVLKNVAIKYLYLEGNQISCVPDSLFFSLPNLLWLDLRNNQITSLPAAIGSHRSLKTLLLEGNPISELPAELGNVITLKGLNLRNCPISFPPQDIVNQGLQSILQYLRSAMANRPVSTRKSSPELPEVEKLQLSELMGSSMEEHDESVDEDELQRFRELKDKMILLDEAELGSVAQCNRNMKSRLLPISTRKKATTKGGIIPEPSPFDTQHWKRPEERRKPAMKELKEKQALVEQRRKSQKAPQKWRTQAKITQGKKISEHKHKEHEIQRKGEEAETDSKPSMQDSSGSPRSQMPSMSVTECEEARSARALEQQGTTTEQMAAAERDVEEMRKLQARLPERKRNLGRNPENCFTVFTGDTFQSFLTSDKTV
ncbi:leucine-rich repeat-containing protein 27-like [Chelmon rostratus]|uniref:leucine-rich repeat-containing protein 27-like n=1 Tax=Chelmon rostratus TaxID=109905 RepID=UPI001BEBEBDB|nr:leucine-rich repeat-containing protein 27-like [Chelmon rostratus]